MFIRFSERFLFADLVEWSQRGGREGTPPTYGDLDSLSRPSHVGPDSDVGLVWVRYPISFARNSDILNLKKIRDLL